MTTITVSLTKDTPFEVLTATSLFIKQVANILHAPDEPQYTFLPELESATVIPFPTPTPSTPTEEGVAPVVSTPAVSQADVIQGIAPDFTSELDSRGFPWDKRIHSETKTRLANGAWRQRRGTPPTLVEQVEAELKNRLRVQATRIAALAVSVNDLGQPPVPAPLPPAPVVAAPSEPTPAPLPPAPVAPLPPAPAPVPVAAIAGRSFDELAVLVTDLIMSETLTEGDVEEVLAANQIEQLSDLRTAPAATVAAVYSQIEERAK